ncbi:MULTISPECIES: phosphoethanolamine transferase [unclassified Aeromonas]|uniref:phosphoethanolamine transferase n=1 Tax=unclassified Aeromonas TaxID=257493 RepID=UPI00352741BE
MPFVMETRVVPFIALLAVVFACLFNWPIWLHLYDILSQLERVKTGFVISLPILLVAALNFVFVPFSIRYLLKPFFALLFVISAIASYTMLKYGVQFDQTMIQNVFETNQSEALAYVSAPIVAWVTVTGILPAIGLFFIKINYANRWYKGLLARALSMLVSLAIVTAIAALYYQDYVSVGRNNSSLKREIVPANVVNSTTKFIYKRFLVEPIPFTTLGDDAKRTASSAKPTLMFLVLGEAARSKNYSMNGYARETNPFTSKAGGVISFRQMRSCGTATAVSVPCMFSNMGREEFDGNLARNSEGLLDVLQKAGISIYWKDNNSNCKGVCDRVPNIQIQPTTNPTLCKGDTCYDEVLLQGLDDEVANMKGDKMLAFHLLGSHGPTYYKRYPSEQRKFVPDCPRSDIENCTTEQLVNTYDNTIRYADLVVARLIARLKLYEEKYNTALIYLSDHGQSLGEMGLYLHSAPYRIAPDEQTRIPMQIWMSPGFIKEKKLNIRCLQKNANATPYSHDNLFSSMLGIWDVKTTVYDKRLDIFSPCRTTQAP